VSIENYFTFVLTPAYIAAANGVLTDEEQRAVEAAIVRNPEVGRVIPGAGVRKLRVALPGRGKRGGARVIYFAVKRRGKVYLLDVFAKAVRENLTQRETQELAKLRRILQEEK
jgi:hypothetical protein